MDHESPDPSPAPEAFLRACRAGDVETVRAWLRRDPDLASTRSGGTTGLHAAAGHPDVLRVLLEHGADPNVRDDGDHALPLHFAAGGGPLESVRTLLDAGSDPQGEGDLHLLDTIGWATCFSNTRHDIVELLVARGARHHVFSAIAMGDPALVRQVVERDPRALDRRLSTFEGELSPVHYVIAPPDGLVGGRFRTGEHYRTLRTLIDLGADVEAADGKGRTPLEVAMLRADHEAMRILREAGAALPAEEGPEARFPWTAAAEAPTSCGSDDGAGPIRPMVEVADMLETIAWYEAIGFRLVATDGADGEPGWACLSLGHASIMLVPGPAGRRHEGVSLWMDTDRLDDLHAAIRARQLAHARAGLLGEEPEGPELPFVTDLHAAFYGQREFGLRDPNGVEVMFAQPIDDDA